MKKYIIAISALLAYTVSPARATEPEADAEVLQPVRAEMTDDDAGTTSALSMAGLTAIWDRANTDYMNANYARAITRYDSIGNAGYSGYKLYYNLGNAYFKEGRIGKSILYYTKALQLNPNDGDTHYNMAIANTYVKDNIESVPEFFLGRWIRSLRNSLSTNAWAAISLVCIAITLAALLLYLLSQRLMIRKTGFYAAITGFALFIFSLAFSISERSDLLDSEDAIVMSSAAPVKSSPDNASRDIFVLHEGTKVEILSSLGEWCEIEIADGNKGWILAASIETIR